MILLLLQTWLLLTLGLLALLGLVIGGQSLLAHLGRARRRLQSEAQPGSRTTVNVTPTPRLAR